ncbi:MULTISPECIES: helix-turn-helix transcriptional regulator [unclassified Saccharopolyspora]|uniref:helix-turn-helix domain-containing protein n=1 Tax=unclassified Saccharopolyspora TaxID=2646250 RepID=UPI001CD1A55F|nr:MULTISPECIES: helix-turn-helix transcriptional regulator [unclassified Saccharopolyspora]MCA1185067.1 helix-turn-helix domain-containing protein [Saccharopolyspora sp. 6T]MCA1224942.1 helix-turn-helix domain-containing protein [Saccharopolyspora sp. 6M]
MDLIQWRNRSIGGTFGQERLPYDWPVTRSKPGSPKARTLGAELRKAREDAGIGVRELARRLDVAHAWVTRTEAGTRTASPEDVGAAAAALGLSAAERERIADIAREGDGPNYLRAGIPGVHQELVTLMNYERTATAISEVAPLLVPGLLQTGDYARAIMTESSPGEVETKVAMRASRRDVLTSRKAPRFEALIAESALTRPIADVETMSGQLRHLQQAAQLFNITIRVIPDRLPRWTPAHSGQFMFFEFPTARPVVHLEHFASAAFLTGDSAIEAYRDALDTLREAALSAEDTLKFIAERSAETGLEES